MNVLILLMLLLCGQWREKKCEHFVTFSTNESRLIALFSLLTVFNVCYYVHMLLPVIFGKVQQCWDVLAISSINMVSWQKWVLQEIIGKLTQFLRNGLKRKTNC